MRRLPVLPALTVAAVSSAVILAGCGSASMPPSGRSGPSPNAAEANPSGDIPDNIAYIAYSPPDGRYSVQVPEGWSRSENGGTVTFTDKLNTASVELLPAPSAPTVATVRDQERTAFGGSATNFAPGPVDTVTRAAGPAVRASYQLDAPPDPVTGKRRHQAVERYSFWRNGTAAVLTLSGPVGADNVDPYRKITDSFGWRS